MGDTEKQDVKITVNATKLLGLFFALILLCGISLGVGYTLGRKSVKPATPVAAPSPAAAAATNKPGAGTAPATAPSAPESSAAAASQTTPATPAPAQQASNAGGLTFYQAVQQKGAHPQLTLPPPAPAQPAAEPQNRLGSGYTVQIAAVSNQDEAHRLRDRLMAEQYPVVITQPGDKLFHVQVGPYPEIHEAELIRARLVSAGWSSAFLKR
jgi:cell division septation protein DedD